MKKLLLTKIIWLLLVLNLCAAALTAQIQPVKDLKPTVILISLDGFRADYLDKYQPQNLKELARTGVRAKWMTPSFPSKTFPNHYTIATGLYPAHHGIVENNVYDFGAIFKMDDRKEVQNPRWWLGEPIWVTAEKQNQIAASYFFPGTETAIKGVKPEIYRAFNGKVPDEMRVDKVLSWLDLPAEKRPTMITLYFSDADDAGHEFSPDSEETNYAVRNVDRLIGRLMDGLRARKIDGKANVIIVSDHGMATENSRQTVFLDEYFDLNLAEPIIWADQIVQIFPKAGSEAKIYDAIKNLPHTSCWRKAEIPARFHYADGARVAPIVCSSEEGWLTTNHKRYDDWAAKQDSLDRPHGAHGYDNQLESMRATFIAHGAAFKKGFVAEPFENIEVYNLMCKILGLTPAKNDGNLEKVKAMLR